MVFLLSVKGKMTSLNGFLLMVESTAMQKLGKQ